MKDSSKALMGLIIAYGFDAICLSVLPFFDITPISLYVLNWFGLSFGFAYGLVMWYWVLKQSNK